MDFISKNLHDYGDNKPREFYFKQDSKGKYYYFNFGLSAEVFNKELVSFVLNGC